MGGLTFSKLFIILVIALIILGPERLPFYAQKLGEFIKTLKKMADGAKERVKEEMGEEFDEVEWKQLDPRQYDPRKIIRDALFEDEDSPEARKAKAIAAAQARRERLQLNAAKRQEILQTQTSQTLLNEVPFDEEAT